MNINNSRILLSTAVVSACLCVCAILPVQAKAPLNDERLNRESHSVGGQHHRPKHRQSHTRYNPWRWGLGWNNYGWGPSIGISWRNGINSHFNYGWGINHYRGVYPYSVINPIPSTQYRTVEQPVTVNAAPQQTTTYTEVSSGLSRLPENAKVIQTDNGTVYEWQGVEYYFDWNTQTYEVAKIVTP